MGKNFLIVYEYQKLKYKDKFLYIRELRCNCLNPNGFRHVNSDLRGPYVLP